MFRKAITLGIVSASILLTACNPVRGAASDVDSVAKCTQEMINRGECKG